MRFALRFPVLVVAQAIVATAVTVGSATGRRDHPDRPTSSAKNAFPAALIACQVASPDTGA